ncbi:hypothetical protein KCTC32516_00659 [Polaribacter huanghezhanensis]|uniref:hypothetical protein n=1 Tax=Polaribacter huanghezhanensis TaxID=1354726 RepID=UPI0026475983|nr:hypothetical protein [Polaribacter huanghezhanensis]WKD85319.1 hypothetical protein KCTC32516_00659 [Polaribacter huanghezhanensis]
MKLPPKKNINTKFYSVFKFILLLLLLLNSKSVSAQTSKDPFKVKGFVDFNIYNDTRNFNTLTYNILLQLSERVQYFSLTNNDGFLGSPDLATTYAEHNLRYKITKKSPLDITMQYVLRKGEQNDDIKLGFRWRFNNTKKLDRFFKKMNLSYSINLMMVQFRNQSKTKYGTQLEHVYNINLFSKKLNNRLYLGGFADQIINYNNGNISFTWVTEHQLGYKFFDRLYLVLEYRVNQFFTKKQSGLGYGLEYKVTF